MISLETVCIGGIILYEVTCAVRGIRRIREERKRRRQIVDALHELATHTMCAAARLERARRLPEERPMGDITRDHAMLAQRIKALRDE
jgi:hypothetical protein